MRTFASVWPDREIVQQPAAQFRGRGRVSSSWTRSPTATPVYGTIGLLLCKGKDRTVVEYALRGFEKPMGVAQWETTLVDSLSDDLKGSLPTVEEIEAESLEWENGE